MKVFAFSSALVAVGLAQDLTWGSSFSDADLKENNAAGLRRSNLVASMTHQVICNTFHAGQDPCPVRAVDVLRALRQYGCNCYSENADVVHQNAGTGGNPSRMEWHMGANGAGIDDLDVACGNLHKAYNCIVMDHADGILNDPRPDSDLASQNCGKTTTFNYHVDVNGDIVCGPSANNANWVARDDKNCQLAACEIEREFAQLAAQFIGSDPRQFRLDRRRSHYKLGDNGDAQCVKQAARPDDCCGDYPFRYPFQSTTRQCCVGGYGTGDVAEIKQLGSC
jgi:hypothetical protein